MIDIKKMCGIRFLKKKPFTGSYEGMRYRLQKTEDEEAGTVTLNAAVWAGQFAYAATDDALKTFNSFEFTDDGFQACVDWLNEAFENNLYKK